MQIMCKSVVEPILNVLFMLVLKLFSSFVRCVVMYMYMISELSYIAFHSTSVVKSMYILFSIPDKQFQYMGLKLFLFANRI